MAPLPTLLPVASRRDVRAGIASGAADVVTGECAPGATAAIVVKHSGAPEGKSTVRFSESGDDLQEQQERDDQLQQQVHRPRIHKSYTARGELLELIDLSVRSNKKFSHLEAGQTGGVYTVPDLTSRCGSPLAVFKSETEEAFQRRGIPSGSGALREEIAYMLDRLTGSWAGVPVTTRTEVPNFNLDMSPADPESDDEGSGEDPKFTRQTSPGSIQQFVHDVAGASEDFGMPRSLSQAANVVPILVAQQIAAFDLRICNTDRHAGNLLFKRCSTEGAEMVFTPVPIDHGCALPRWWAMAEANFEAWASWPQVHAPCLPEVIGTVEMAYKERNVALRTLANMGLEPAAQATYSIALALLREVTVRHGLSLAAVATLVGRDHLDPSEPSWLETCMEVTAAELGISWRWTETAYGDRVPAEPEQPAAWPPSGFVERLEETFRTDTTRIAAERWLSIRSNSSY